jgi:hypothetical protein
MAPECKGMLRLYTLKDLHERGITYTRTHLRRLEVEGKIPPLHRRAPGCRTFFTDEHLVALTGRKPAATA